LGIAAFLPLGLHYLPVRDILMVHLNFPMQRPAQPAGRLRFSSLPSRADLKRIIRFVPDYFGLFRIISDYFGLFRIISDYFGLFRIIAGLLPDYCRIIAGLLPDFRLVQGRGVRQQPGPGIGKGVKTRFRGLWRFWPCQGTGRAICVAWRPVSGGFLGVFRAPSRLRGRPYISLNRVTPCIISCRARSLLMPISLPMSSSFASRQNRNHTARRWRSGSAPISSATSCANSRSPPRSGTDNPQNNSAVGRAFDVSDRSMCDQIAREA